MKATKLLVDHHEEVVPSAVVPALQVNIVSTLGYGACPLHFAARMYIQQLQTLGLTGSYWREGRH